MKRPKTTRWRTPLFHLGDVVECEVRGEVTICGISCGRVQWPIGKRHRQRSLVVYGDLAAAVRAEANVTVCKFWGVTPQTVSKWRKALDVGPMTPGTRKLRKAIGADPDGVAARTAGLRGMSDEAKAARAQKIAAAKRGKPRPPKVRKLLRTMNRGRKASLATRQKLSEDRRARGVRPPKAGRPWTPAEDQLLLAFAPAEVARRTGRTLPAVYSRRDDLRSQGQPVPDGRRT